MPDIHTSGMFILRLWEVEIGLIIAAAVGCAYILYSTSHDTSWRLVRFNHRSKQERDGTAGAQGERRGTYRGMRSVTVVNWRMANSKAPGNPRANSKEDAISENAPRLPT